MDRRSSGALLAMLACAHGCSEERVQRAERLGIDPAAIVNGIEDTPYDAQFPGAVAFRGKGCSGTLVTPQWVLTAEHCFDGENANGVPEAELDWTIHVGPAPQGDPADPLYARRDVMHTRVHPEDNVKRWLADSFRETDLALIRLDDPVRHPIGLPAELPVTTGCGATFQGRLVGYSGATYNEAGYAGHCGDDEVRHRRFGNAPLDWDLTVDAPGGRYVHTFTSTVWPDVCDELAGIGVGGDSGGGALPGGDGLRPGAPVRSDLG